MHSEYKFLELSDYKILHSIGKGRFSEVYLVKHKQTNKSYAAKVSNFIFDENTQNESETLALLREV